MTTEEFITLVAERLDKYDDPIIEFVDEGGYGSILVEINTGETFLVTAFEGGNAID